MIQTNLKMLLAEHNMTQKELCEKIHARPSTICNLYNNQAISIKLKLIADICQALECSIGELFHIV